MATIRIDLRNRSLFGRIVFAALLLAVLVLGLFFLAAALIAGAILATAAVLRLWWLKRRLARAEEARFIQAQYTVVEREPAPPPRLPSRQ